MKKKYHIDDKPHDASWNVHLRPDGKRRANKSSRKGGKKDIAKQMKDLTIKD